MTIEADGKTLVGVNLNKKLLQDATDLIPNHGFKENQSLQRMTLHNKIDAMNKQIAQGALESAKTKLIDDMRDKL